jgi:hypothetical protein
MFPFNPGVANANAYGNPADRLDFSAILRLVYLWLAVGLTVGFGVAFTLGESIKAQIAAGQPSSSILLLNPIAMIGAIVVYLVLGFGFYPIVQRASVAVGMALYLLFTAVFGFMTASIFVVYTPVSIAVAVFITAAMFGAMTLIGFTTKLDLSKMGSILLMALVGIIIASVVNYFLHSTVLYWIVSLAGVVIFSGLTAYDTQWIKRNALSLASAPGAADGVVVRRIALIGAFRLVLDFVNLFLSLLRIYGGGRQ